MSVTIVETRTNNPQGGDLGPLRFGLRAMTAQATELDTLIQEVALQHRALMEVTDREAATNARNAALTLEVQTLQAELKASEEKNKQQYALLTERIEKVENKPVPAPAPAPTAQQIIQTTPRPGPPPNWVHPLSQFSGHSWISTYRAPGL